jgi:CheY-like chemotaxis protein
MSKSDQPPNDAEGVGPHHLSEGSLLIRRTRALITTSRLRIAGARKRIVQSLLLHGESLQRLPNRDQPPRALTGITVVLVDDDDDTVELFSTFLGLCGATVLSSRTGAEALALFADGPRADVIITDVSMPVINGFELVRAVRSISAYAALPAIAISGFPERHFGDQAREFSVFMLKPIEMDDLLAVIQRLVGHREASVNGQ